MLVKLHLYSDELEDDDYFFFNVNNDLRGKPIICKGSDSQHFRLLFSSKRLLQNVEHVGVFHVDGTYKITIQDFPLVVFGVTECISSNMLHDYIT